MKEEIHFTQSALYYKMKLRELADDTINPHSGFPFGVKENRQGGNIVVVADGDCFNIYRLEGYGSTLFKSFGAYYSIISFSGEGISVETRLRKRALYFYMIWVLFAIGFGTLLLWKDNFGGLFFMLIAMAAFLIMPRRKRQFYQFTIDVLKGM